MTHRGKIWKIFLLCLGMVRSASVRSSAAQHIPLVLVTLLLNLCCGLGAGGVSGVQRAMAKGVSVQAPQEKSVGTHCNGGIGIHRESGLGFPGKALGSLTQLWGVQKHPTGAHQGLLLIQEVLPALMFPWKSLCTSAVVENDPDHGFGFSSRESCCTHGIY